MATKSKMFDFTAISKILRRPLVMVALVCGGALCFKAANVVDGFSGVAIAAEEEAESAAAAQDEPGDDEVLIDAPTTALVEDPAMMSQSELALLRDLSSRRNDLDARAQDLDMRSRLLEATERRVETKIGELKSLETRVKGLLLEHETQENEKLVSLVKVYEKMKPADAARVLEGLDMGLQIEVAQRMSALRMAPIMSKMSAKGAQKLTTQLAMKQTINLTDGVN